MVKVTFQIVEDHITELIKEDSVQERILHPIELSTKTASKSCPYNIANIEYPEKTTFTIVIDESVAQTQEPVRKHMNTKENYENYL